MLQEKNGKKELTSFSKLLIIAVLLKTIITAIKFPGSFWGIISSVVIFAILNFFLGEIAKRKKTEKINPIGLMILLFGYILVFWGSGLIHFLAR